MVAESSMNGCIEGDALVERSRSQREEATLTGARHTHLLSVPGRIFCQIVECTNTTHHHALIIMFIAIIHIKLPIAHQCTVKHVVVHLLLHGYWYAMNTYFERDGALLSRIDIATIRTHTSPRHTQQHRILTLLHRHSQNTIRTIVRLYVIKRYFVDVYILRAALWQQSFRRVQWRFARLVNGILPERTKVVWHHR